MSQIQKASMLDFGHLALVRKKSPEPNSGECDVDLYFGNVEFVPGDYLYADEDGIITSEEELFM